MISVTKGLRLRPMRRLLRLTIFRYLLVGGTLFLIDLTIVYALAAAGMHPGWAQLIGRGTGALLGFLGHRLITFRDTESLWGFSLGAQGFGYLLVAITTLVVSPFVLLACLKLTLGQLVLAKIITEVILVSGMYIMLRIVFLKRARD